MTELGRRLFIGVRLPDESQPELRRRAESLSSSFSCKSITALGNFHITLDFLGQCDGAQEAAARRAASASADLSEPFSLRIVGCGRFAKKTSSVIWLGLEDGQGLLAIRSLQKSLTETLRDRDFVVPESAYVPHVTLARGARLADVDRRGDPDAALRQLSEGWRPIDVNVDAISLMWSHRDQSTGSLRYDPIAMIPLGPSE